MRHRRRLLMVFAAGILLAGLICGFVFSRPAFDPREVGRAEAAMWRAYYAGDRNRLGLLLVSLLRKQYGLTAPEAKHIGELLASSAMAFRATRKDYDVKVLPPLTEAYDAIRTATGADFDALEAARLELAWWVARRTRGGNLPVQVGEKIGELYAVLYGKPHPSFRQAGILRAQAGALRDAGGAKADWPEIESLLVESYTTLQRAL